MCLSPGMVTLQSSRKEAIQPGTKESDAREMEESISVRHRAIVGNEFYTRTLPPAFWFKRNQEALTKIMAEGYEPTLAAAEDMEKSTTRDIKDLKEKTWEEEIKLTEAELKAKAKREKKMMKKDQPASLAPTANHQVELTA